MRRFVRKHSFALALVAIVLGLVFLPALGGRIVSPNDVYLHYDPWASVTEGRAQNPLVHDPPLSYYTLAAMLKRGDFFHWNPFVGGGIPGVGSVASAMLSPFALLPALLLPLPFFYTGMLVTKVGFSFWMAYLWLREERLGKKGAAVGATVVAAAGPYAVWWLWQGTNATALYPALLYACARLVHGKSNRFWLLAILALAFLLSGFPATIAYGAYLAAAYVTWGLVANLRFPWKEIRKAMFAAAVALLLSLPVLAPFASFLSRTGYLESRADASTSYYFPWGHLRSFVQPYWLGDPVTRSWIGDSALGPMNNFVEATVYVGLLTLPLALLGFVRRRSSMRWFFGLLAVVLVSLMFGSGGIAPAVADLPGLKYSPMVRLRVVLPIAAAFLAASGFALVASRRRFAPAASPLGRVPLVVALGIAADLGLFAAWFTPQIPWKLATPPASDTIHFLQSEADSGRVAPTFPYLMPNSAQLVEIEDIRAHWGAERAWRDLLRRIDPGSVDVTTVATLNSLRMRLDDPLLSMLNVRYLVEPPKIDILRYLIQDRTEWIVRPVEPLRLGSGDEIEVAVDDRGCQAVAIPYTYRGRAGADPWISATATDATGAPISSVRFDADEASRIEGALHVPLRAIGAGARIRIASNGVWADLARDEARAVSWGCVRFPIVHARSFRDGRVFENLDARPRFYPGWDIVHVSRDELLADTTRRIHEVTAFHDAIPIDVARLANVPHESRDAVIEIGPLRNGTRVVAVSSKVPFLLVSSEKVTPELEVRIDGREARVHTVNTMFAALLVPPGDHEVVFERRIGRGFWPWSAAGLLLFVVGSISDRRAARPE